MHLNIAILSLALLWTSTSCHVAYVCEQVAGSLVQIDAGGGQVFGVNREDDIFTRYGSSWVPLPGKLKHVTVGPAGVWGVNKENNIFKLVAGDWVQVTGLLKQVDAGGDGFVAGVNFNNAPFCLSKDYAKQPVPNGAWSYIPGILKYYSCGPISCWGVNHHNQIFIRKGGVTPSACAGGDWLHIPGHLVMIEVGEDGSVHGVNHYGQIYRRTGITPHHPEGNGWAHINFSGEVKHVSYDLGHLWIISKNDQIYDCK